MSKLLALPLLCLALPVCLTGCISTTRSVQKVQAPDQYRTAGVDVLERIVSQRDAALNTLNASVNITATTGGGKEGKVTTYTSLRGFIFMRKPRDLRVILQLPVVGSEAMDMVSTGLDFTMVIPPRKQAIQGSDKVTKPSSNSLENIRPAVFFDSLLVPGVKPEEYVTLTESTRVLQPEKGRHAAIEEPDYDLAVLQATTDHQLRQTRVIHISRVNMLPFEQDIFDEHGRVVTQATYDGYRDFGGTQFPTIINIRRPLDELALKLEIAKLTLNAPFEADQFDLKIPSGYNIRHME